MCRATKCAGCGKTTWAGCGKHIDSALGGVAMANRCDGWRTGICHTLTSPAVATVSKTCPTCTMALEAADQATLDGLWGQHTVRFPACAVASAIADAAAMTEAI